MGDDALVGLGRADDVARRRGLQPAQLPQRHGLAARQLADRVGARPLRPLARGAPHRPLRCSTPPATFGYQLPEVFAGLSRAETPFPIAYPTAARPQAWAAGTPVLLLQLLLGIQPDRRRHALETRRAARAAVWAGDVRLSGVRAFDRPWDVRVENGDVTVTEA